jgi:hypothetical protein
MPAGLALNPQAPALTHVTVKTHTRPRAPVWPRPCLRGPAPAGRKPGRGPAPVGGEGWIVLNLSTVNGRGVEREWWWMGGWGGSCSSVLLGTEPRHRLTGAVSHVTGAVSHVTGTVSRVTGAAP